MENWYCIYTKTHCEDHVFQRLGSVPEITVLNPKIKRNKYHNGRVKEVIEHCFPCYLFSQFNPSKYLHLVTYTRGIRRVVGDGSGIPYIVDEAIIGQLLSMMTDGFVELKQPSFNRGEEVIIQDGPLSGFKGIFQREIKARDRVIILLKTIANQVSIDLDKSMVVKA